jgi:predicted ATPase/tRNA A-37 threonylcarbamoyl transferase component Bud32
MSYLAGVTIGYRYQIVKQLGSGGMGTVYQALDRLNQQMIALKSVTSSVNALSSEANDRATKIALTNEFQVLASLHHPHVIRVLDYGFDVQQYPFFTMNLLQDAQPITKAAEGQSQQVKLRFIIELFQALAYLHQRGIVHRDLKPDNALVTVDGEVKVLDFGLAVLRDYGLSENEDEVSGTLAYMAPETLRGVPASSAADLYTAGVIAYELLAGRHPFDTPDLGQLIQDILSTPPNLDFLQVNEGLRHVLARLLEKSSADRYLDAFEVLTALSTATAIPIPIESSAIRESFLQAARFVGREKELTRLTGALSKSLENKGSVWLIGGESGVGKSRLLEELRVRALVEGMVVLQGQEVEGSGFTYQLWREPLRRLVLMTALNDTDVGTLFQIVPDIEELLGRPITPAPELSGQEGQQRLLSTIVSVFLRQKQPILLILEDLEWANDSLHVLEQLLPVTASLPLLVVGSYRHDERPSLPDQLQGAHLIRLERLDEQGIAELSASMLGDVRLRPEVLALLKRETEGNAFFLVEVVRALSEVAGGLNAIKSMDLPSRILANGVEQVVQNRLKRLPVSARPLLNLAAIIGRQIDLALLRTLEATCDLEEWLNLCSNAVVLEVQDQRWRFVHDRLREGILSGLTNDQSRELQRRVATAFEVTYADSANEYAARIADHYEAAGDLERALTWYVRAGRYAESTYSPALAIAYFQKALTLWHYGGEQGVAAIQLVNLYERLGELLNWSARFDEAIESFKLMQQIAETAGDKVTQSTAWYGIARAQTYQGALVAALESATRAEALAQGINSSVHLAHALWMKGWIQFRLGNVQSAQELAKQVLQLSQERNTSSLLGNTHNLLGVIQITVGRYAEAVRFFENALEIFQKLGDRLRAMTIVNNLGWLAETRGDYNLAYSRYQEALTLARENGHRNAEIVYLSNLGGSRVMRGEYVAAEVDLRQAVELSSDSEPDILSETYRFLAEAYLQQGKITDALRAARRALSLGQKFESRDYVAAAWRVLGLVASEWFIPITITSNAALPAERYDARACFAESLRVCEEGDVKAEKAKTLRTWAQYELGQGKTTEAMTMWRAAREIFTQLGADWEVQRMDDIFAS